ncbi:MAG: hypothetical protein RQ985_02465 [Dehalococcoidia bacterium]|jgi:DNA-directed RNA polymerase subunit M/transcription elongation factor TFIIS|nr:hypothetical protein [Dehalococcoidia bacterium]
MGAALRCPRCTGMMYVEVLLGDEADLVCIQCGYRSPLAVQAQKASLAKAA